MAVEWLKPDNKEPLYRRVARDVQDRLIKKIMLAYFDRHPAEDLSFFSKVWSHGGASKVEIVTLGDGSRILREEGDYVLNPRCKHADAEVHALPVMLAGRELGDQAQPAKIVYA
jgi:hypothetical protein